jgi:hypothetical protein
LFTNSSGSYTGPNPNEFSVDMNGLKSQDQVPPDSSPMVSVVEPVAPVEDLVLGEELLLLLQAAASRPAVASTAVSVMYLGVKRLM